MKDTKISSSAEARNLKELEAISGNLYLSAVVIAKRANQISAQVKEELSGKLAEFATDHDNLEEVHENREQIEISAYYEKIPKATLVATQEFIDGKIYYRLPENEAEE
ncbi:MAG: DNA-directed RNA polymerase subunit omega [bacterium]|nr:DNA-directed RNA polymerase subunit omega [bacterium]